MWVLRKISGESTNPDYRDRLTLYDRYGAMAYGVITQIVPQPAIAQTVLVELFASSQVAFLPTVTPTQTACAIVRLARLKAIEARQEVPVLSGFDTNADRNDNLPELVFDLSFNQGYRLEFVAQRLEMKYLDVLQAMRQYVRSLCIR